MLAGGVGVERTTEYLERQGQLLGAASPRPLEHHVLEHVRNAHLLGALVQRCCAHPRPQCDRPYSRHVLREYGQPVRQNGTAQFRFGGLRSEGHSRERPPSLPRPPPRGRRGRSPRSPRSERSPDSPLSPPSAPTAAIAGDSPRPTRPPPTTRLPASGSTPSSTERSRPAPPAPRA